MRKLSITCLVLVVASSHAPTTMSHDVSTILQAWGFGLDISGIVVNAITNKALGSAGTHDDKFIVELQGSGGARLFVGAANRDWPAAERIEERFSAVSRAACAFPDGVTGRGENASTVVVVAPLRRPTGEFLWTDEHSSSRRYLTPALPGTDLKQLSSYVSLAYALGGYHRIMSAAGRPSGNAIRGQDLDRDVASYVQWLATVWEQEAAAPREGFDALLIDKLRNTSRFIVTRTKRLAALPRTWIHDDFQFKNVVQVPPPHSKMAVIDMPDGSWAPRLFDLAFVVGNHLPTPAAEDASSQSPAAPTSSTHFDGLMHAYHRGGGDALTDEEAELLPNVMQIKFLAEAHFWYHNAPNVVEFRDRAHRASPGATTRELIRAAARRAAAAQHQGAGSSPLRDRAR